jgi:adenylate cyclase class 2
MYEVEVKVRADHGSVREKLAELDAETLEPVEQVDTYYDHPGRDFGQTDEALRIRRERLREATEAIAKVTYKGPLVDEASKSREEFETGVDDGETMASILSGLGFEPAATVEKTRERFRVDRYTVTLDSVDGLGEFVEVETESESEAVDSAREGAFDLLENLGLDPDDQIRTSYLGLLLADR